MTESNVLRETVAKSLCCGCGVCAGICPKGSLEMRFNSQGEFVPGSSGDCAECRLCLTVCPALEVGETPSPEKLFGTAPAGSNAHVGSYAALFAGYSKQHRVKAASGGMATWTLEELLRTGEIDAAVCVTASQKGDRFFEPTIARSTSALENCSGTKYYPVEYSEAVAHILSHEGKYAVIALPCVVTALRKAQGALPVLRERIHYVFALACGHGVSKRFTQFLLSVVGLDESKTQDIDFRYTAGSNKSSNYAFRARGANGKRSRPLFQSGLLGRLWGGRFFVPTACEFCGDLFSPLADATFMDAWLPQYVDDPRGTSIVVVRQAELVELMEEGDCQLRSIAIEDVLRSQAAALSYKTALLPLRVARAERDGLRVPRSVKRVPVPTGIREKLAKAKLLGRRQLCERAFDRDGRARGFWVSVLTAILRGQAAWRTTRGFVRGLRERTPRP